MFSDGIRNINDVFVIFYYDDICDLQDKDDFNLGDDVILIIDD